MNVNPFSYLIEKLKGKVDKHTNWVEATDINTVKAQGVYPLSQYNTNLPSIGSDAEWSTLYVSGNENDVMSQIFVSRGNRIFFRHCVSGAWGSWNELALTSDLGVTYSKTVSNMSINSAVGNLFEGVVGVPTDTSGVGKRVVATFVPTSSFAFAVIRSVTASEVNISLEKGNSGTVSGTVYVTIYP